ncbi:MAG: tetratricopeptide repeat protein [Pseudomonadota bacterium]
MKNQCVTCKSNADVRSASSQKQKNGLRHTLCGLFGLLLPFSAISSDYNAGLKAYSSEDFKSAAKIWSDSSLKSDAEAQFGLGVLYVRGMGVEQDVSRGVGLYKKAARMGHPSAQFNLGLAYYTERGTEYSPGKAKLWWEKAAVQGHPSAQYNLASMLWSGKGIKKDQASAMQWFRKAIRSGSREALVFLRDLYQPMYTVLTENISKIAKRGGNRGIPLIEEMGMYKLAQKAMERGSHNQAYRYLQPLAEDGHPESQYDVATLLEQGLGVDQNLEEAIDWYKVAAESGSPKAQFRIGLYHMNESSDVNPALGLYWIQSAADNNYEDAKKYLEQNL